MSMSFFGRLLIVAAALLVSPAHAAVWTIDAANSKLGFETTLFGSPLSGSFNAWTADIDFDAQALETSSISVVIDMKSADTDDATRDETLKGPEWFAADEHPQATFKSTRIRATGENTFEMDADLTIRGNTVPVVLPFTLETIADTTRATGAVTIDRTRFDVGQGDFVTDSVVALEVTVAIDVLATPSN